MDPDEQRAQLRECWEAAAAAWEGPAGRAMAEAMLPVSHAMVQAIDPQPGQVVLELAGGPGEVGLLAAELLHPGGRLIETDGAEAMVEVARRRADERGIQNVEFKPMELEWIDAETASIDAVVCRFGYMLALDPETALRETRRVLRAGGRLALAVWADREANPWMAVPAEEVQRTGLVPPEPPGAPGPFALADPAALEELLLVAGFEDVVITPVDLTFTAPTPDAFWERSMDVSPSRRQLLARLAPADVYRLRDAVDERWAPYVRPDGAIAIPGRALVAAASA